jgi:hypothetical protein
MLNSVYDTPKKARIKGAADYMKYKKIPFSHIDLFRFYGVGKTQGWSILQQDSEQFDRRHHSNEVVQEKRGRPLALSPKDLCYTGLGYTSLGSVRTKAR